MFNSRRSTPAVPRSDLRPGDVRSSNGGGAYGRFATRSNAGC